MQTAEDILKSPTCGCSIHGKNRKSEQRLGGSRGCAVVARSTIASLAGVWCAVFPGKESLSTLPPQRGSPNGAFISEHA